MNTFHLSPGLPIGWSASENLGNYFSYTIQFVQRTARTGQEQQDGESVQSRGCGLWVGLLILFSAIDTPTSATWNSASIALKDFLNIYLFM